MSTNVLIKDKANGELVMATLIEDVDPAELVMAEASWKPVREAAVSRLCGQGLTDPQIAGQLQHAHWNWVAKMPTVPLLALKFVGIKHEGLWQGLSLLDTARRTAWLPPDRGRPLVYVDYLESAPWNLADFVAQPKYGLIGFRLMEYAVRYSQAEGFHGRVGLLALPQAEQFYRNGCGMVRVDQAGQHGMAWFEFSREQAAVFLSGGVQ